MNKLRSLRQPLPGRTPAERTRRPGQRRRPIRVQLVRAKPFPYLWAVLIPFALVVGSAIVVALLT